VSQVDDCSNTPCVNAPPGRTKGIRFLPWCHCLPTRQTSESVVTVARSRLPTYPRQPMRIPAARNISLAVFLLGAAATAVLPDAQAEWLPRAERPGRRGLTLRHSRESRVCLYFVCRAQEAVLRGDGVIARWADRPRMLAGLCAENQRSTRTRAESREPVRSRGEAGFVDSSRRRPCRWMAISVRSHPLRHGLGIERLRARGVHEVALRGPVMMRAIPIGRCVPIAPGPRAKSCRTCGAHFQAACPLNSARHPSMRAGPPRFNPR